MQNTFGQLLKELRKSKYFTQEDLALRTGYSKDTIRGIENDRLKASSTLINKLSYIFNIDLNKYFYAIENDVPVLLENTYYSFRNAIESNDIHILEKLISEHSNDIYFKSGRGLELIYYSQAMCYYNDNKQKALALALKALSVNNLSIDTLNLTNEIYTITTYNLIGFVGVLYFDMGHVELSENILFDLYNKLKSYFFSDSTFLNYNLLETIRLYIILINNLATIEIEKRNFTVALEYINEAIDFCIKNYKTNLLSNLYFTKFECYYHLERFEEAVNIFENVLTLASISNPNLINIHLQDLISNYSKILTHIDIHTLNKKYSGI